MIQSELAVISFLANVREYDLGLLVNLTHHAHLELPLLNIFLVDTNSINPQGATITNEADSAYCRVQTRRDRKLTVIDRYEAAFLRVSPCIRQAIYLRFVFMIALEREPCMGSSSCPGKTSSNRIFHPLSNGWYSYLAIDTSVAMSYSIHMSHQLLLVGLEQLRQEYL